MSSNSTIPLVFLSRPLALYHNLALLYNFEYRQPLRQYRVTGTAARLLSEAVAGHYESFNEVPANAACCLPGFGSCDLPIEAAVAEVVVVDGSIGGPSMWGRNVARQLWRARRRCLFLSYHRGEAFFAGDSLPRPEPWNKFTFIHWTRALVQRLQPARLLIIGREVAAKLFDLFVDVPATVVESGFAEDSITAEPVSGAVLRRSLVELLFRADTFPWDNLAHSLGAAAAIRGAALNVLWSESIYRTLRQRFREAELKFVPPSVDTSVFQKIQCHSDSDPQPAGLRVLLGAGAHSLGNNGRDFLAIQPLIEAAANVEGCRVTILTADPERLGAAIGGAPHVAIQPRIEWERMPEVFSRHDVYYRVQNDSSLPTSCVEAMASGLPVIVNESTAPTFTALSHGENVFQVAFGDVAALTRALEKLATDAELRGRISAAGAKLARARCDFSANLQAIGWER